MKPKPLTLSMMARMGGLSKSQAKSEAARRNGLLGGRKKWKKETLNGHVPTCKESLTVQNPDDEVI